MTQLSKDDVLKVAGLAKLRLNEEEILDFTEKLGSIIALVDQLSQVQTADVEPMAHPLDAKTVLRADVLHKSLAREQALSNAPDSNGEYFLVPPVMAK